MSVKIFGDKWLDNEIEILTNDYPILGPLGCSKKLNRTVRACQLKAKKLDLKYKVIKDYYEEENLRKIVERSTSYSNCLGKIGISTRPGNYDTLKKYIKLYNIDISHFSSINFSGLKDQSNFIKRETIDVLVENSTFSRRSLKKRLYDEGLKIKKCEICGMGEDWFNGLKIVHILDHINGINDDNRIENLRIVCPNCNSTLDTSTGKNKIKDKNTCGS